jgi:tRNA nucleotidyltransferase (CCA-adding enzyme)
MKQFNFPPELVDLRGKFVSEGFDIRLVGGCVRDLLHGDEPHDIDLCTDATPDEQVEMYKKYDVRHIETGLQHGTVTVVLNGITYEITSLRTDTECDGRHATVSYTRDWLIDIERRDLTINAMSLTFDGELIDPFNGKSDLENQIVRFVGDPEKRITEDYLRILRWFRFYGRYGNVTAGAIYAVPPGHAISDFPACNIQDTIRKIAALAGNLTQISPERKWSELSKIMVGPNAHQVLRLMTASSVLQYCWLPTSETYPNIDEEVARTIELTKNPITVFWQMYTMSDNAYEVFKWSSNERALFDFLCKHYVGGKHVTKKVHPDYDAMVTVDKFNKEFVRELMVVNDCDELKRISFESWDPPSFPVSGNDIMAVSSVSGPALGKMIKDLKLVWRESGFTMTKEKLLALVNKT